MPCEKCGAERPSRIPGSRLNPNVFVWTFAKKPAVRDTVQSHTACQHHVFHAGLHVHIAAHSQDDLFCDRLDTCRQVHVPLLNIGLGIPRWAAE